MNVIAILVGVVLGALVEVVRAEVVRRRELARLRRLVDDLDARRSLLWPRGRGPCPVCGEPVREDDPPLATEPLGAALHRSCAGGRTIIDTTPGEG
jgi:hypothetical protein